MIFGFVIILLIFVRKLDIFEVFHIPETHFIFNRARSYQRAVSTDIESFDGTPMLTDNTDMSHGEQMCSSEKEGGKTFYK